MVPQVTTSHSFAFSIVDKNVSKEKPPLNGSKNKDENSSQNKR